MPFAKITSQLLVGKGQYVGTQSVHLCNIIDLYGADNVNVLLLKILHTIRQGIYMFRNKDFLPVSLFTVVAEYPSTMCQFASH